MRNARGYRRTSRRCISNQLSKSLNYCILSILYYCLVIGEHQVASMKLQGMVSSSLPRKQSFPKSSGVIMMKDQFGSIRSSTFITRGIFLQSHDYEHTSKATSPFSSPRSIMIFSSTPGRTSHVANISMMAKGDGKKKRKKQSDSSSSSSPSPAPQPAVPRVTNDINISVRRQIRYAKLNKQHRESGSTSFRQAKKVVRTKYRRTWDEEEIEQKAEERRRKGQDPDWDIILNRTSTSPLVIVDGYNIIHKWSRLKKHMVKGDVARARQLLLEDLENLKSIKGWRIEVVFDGTGKIKGGPLGDTRQRLSAADRATSKEVSKHGVRTVFTGSGIEADSYIEARCAEAKNVTEGAMTGSFIVATDDTMIRLAGINAGALCMSADRFVNELKAVKKAVAYRVEAAMAKVNGNPIRPEKLWGTDVFSNNNRNARAAGRSLPNKDFSKNSTSSSSLQVAEAESGELPDDFGDRVQKTEDGKTIYTGRFGRSSLIIEDKRKKKPPQK